MHGWLSPNFGPTGCVGAIIWTLIVAGAALGLVLMAWYAR
jgi:hypothetical protein